MEIFAFTLEALGHYQYWQENDRGILRKINQLLKECLRTPFAGTGKPEPLKGEFSGLWSRRLNHEHRLVYEAKGNTLLIIGCRYHYSKR